MTFQESVIKAKDAAAFNGLYSEEYFKRIKEMNSIWLSEHSTKKDIFINKLYKKIWQLKAKK